MTKEDVLTKANNLYTNILVILADTIKGTRNMPITELSKLSGVSTTVISDFENKKYLPKIDVILRLLSALDISLTDCIENSSRKDIKYYLEANRQIAEDDTYSVIGALLSDLGLGLPDIHTIIDYAKYKVDVKVHKYSQNRKNK